MERLIHALATHGFARNAEANYGEMFVTSDPQDAFINDLPAGILIRDQDVAARYLTDFRRKYTGRALGILRPSCLEEVVTCVRAAARHGIAIVPQGGNTSYCAGATPDDSGNQVVMSLERMNRVREIDAENRSVIVEAGTILSNLQSAVAEFGFECPVALGSQQSCQIGGNISTNAGGINVVGAGMMRDVVMGLEVVLPDGCVLDTLSPLRKDNSGYAVDQLFIGGEGTLGIVTAASLRLRRKPVQTVTAFLSCETTDMLPAMLERLQSVTGDAVVAFEYIGHPALQNLLDKRPELRSPVSAANPHYLLVELATTSPHLPLESIVEAEIATLFEEGLVSDGIVAASESQRLALWELRESIPEGEVLNGGSVKHDIAVRISRLPTFIAKASAFVQREGRGARLSVYGHVGDGNIHFNVMPAVEDSEISLQWIEQELSPAIYELAMSMGGTFSAEYGIGKAKLDLQERFGNAVKVDLMMRIKSALDPDFLLNPGKVVRPS